jgi:hypothetical protein
MAPWGRMSTSGRRCSSLISKGFDTLHSETWKRSEIAVVRPDQMQTLDCLSLRGLIGPWNLGPNARALSVARSENSDADDSQSQFRGSHKPGRRLYWR